LDDRLIAILPGQASWTVADERLEAHWHAAHVIEDCGAGRAFLDPGRIGTLIEGADGCSKNMRG
jgi:hypothetical protein